MDVTAEKPKDGIVLVIDDDRYIRLFIKSKLKDSFVVLEADNGKAGLAAALKSSPDLIITDIMMPQMNGLKLTSLLKNNHITSHIPVLILTALGNEEEKIEGLETGADDYLIKPFSADELTLKVRNHIKLRKTLREKYSGYPAIYSPNGSFESQDNQFLNRVITIIENNLSNLEFSAKHLSSEMAMSISQLNRKLNVLTGKAAGQLIRAIRLHKAVDYLKSGDSIKNVSWMVGYSEQSNFASSFKQYFGVTPLEFVKK